MQSHEAAGDDVLDLDVSDRLLTTTRSVRRLMDLERPVDPDLIRRAIEVATFAPNARNEQDWRWLVITEPAQKQALVSAIRSPSPGTPGRTTGRPVDERISASARHLSANLERVHAFVLAAILGQPPVHSKRELADFYGSIIPAVWNLQLALRARGLGSVYTTSFLAHEQEVRRVLGVPEEVTMAALIPVGHIKGRLNPPPRRPVDEVIFWQRWPAGAP